MSAAKRRVDEPENAVAVNPFEPDVQASQGFKMDDLLVAYTGRLAESDKRKIGIQDRIKKNLDAIGRIQNLIEALSLKAQQESGATWVNVVVRPIAAELAKVFPAASIEVTPMNGSVIVTLSKKGISPADKMKGVDCRSVTVVQQDGGLCGIRDFSRDTGDYPQGSLGALAGLNHPVVPISADRIIPTMIEWLLK